MPKVREGLLSPEVHAYEHYTVFYNQYAVFYNIKCLSNINLIALRYKRQTVVSLICPAQTREQ